jgi:hypothetical protein
MGNVSDHGGIELISLQPVDKAHFHTRATITYSLTDMGRCVC